MDDGAERRLAAILSADVVGYTRLMSQDEAATIRGVTHFRDEVALRVRQHRGRVVDSPGDNVLAEFPTALEALAAAVEIQRGLGVRNAELPPERRMECRIGVHIGEIAADGERIYGDGVNIAARLEAEAPAGGICVSAAVYDLARGKLSVGFEDLGARALKNVPQRVHAYRVRLDAAAPRRRTIPRRSVGIAAGVLVVVGFVAWLLWPGAPQPATRPEPALALPDKPSIAVLPFANMSPDPDQEYFADGMTEDLITELARISGLFVIARNSVFVYKGKPVHVRDVGRDLGVRYVLEGSVRRDGDRVRITAQLVDAASGHHLWAERYDRDLDGVFALQDEITEEIVSALEVRLSEGERAAVERVPTGDPEAHSFFLRGQSYRWSFTRDANRRAEQMFERAIERDPEFAAAYAALALVYMQRWIVQWSQDEADLERGVDLARQAITIDRSHAMAHSILGFGYTFSGEPDRALAAGRRAIEVGPNDAMAASYMALFHEVVGNPEEARREFERAVRLDPENQFPYFNLGTIQLEAGQSRQAIATFKRVLDQYPEFVTAYVFLAVAYEQVGMEAEARAAASEVLRISPEFTLSGFERRLPFDRQRMEPILAALARAGLR